jgi:hypothetical protein
VRSVRRKRSYKYKLHQTKDILTTESEGSVRDGSYQYKEFDFRREVDTVYQNPGVRTRSVRSVQWFMQYSGLRRRSSRDLDGLLPDPCAEQDDFTTLVVGCSTMDTMEFHSDCTSADVVSGIYRCFLTFFISLSLWMWCHTGCGTSQSACRWISWNFTLLDVTNLTWLPFPLYLQQMNAKLKLHIFLMDPVAACGAISWLWIYQVYI